MGRRFGTPYRHDNGEWAIDVTGSNNYGCLGFLGAFFDIFAGTRSAASGHVTTYSSVYGHVWRNVITGHRPDVFYEGYLGDHLKAWKHRQKTARTAKPKKQPKLIQSSQPSQYPIPSLWQRVPPKPKPKKAKIVAQRRQAGLNECPYCLAEVNPDTSTVCVGCLARHHVACWDEHGACAACNKNKRLVQERA